MWIKESDVTDLNHVGTCIHLIRPLDLMERGRLTLKSLVRLKGVHSLALVPVVREAMKIYCNDVITLTTMQQSLTSSVLYVNGLGQKEGKAEEGGREGEEEGYQVGTPHSPESSSHAL